MGHYHVVLTTPEALPEKLTLTVVERQQMPDIGKIDSEKKNLTKLDNIYNDRRKVNVNFKNETDKLNIVGYRYRNNWYLKDKEVDLKLTEYQPPLAIRVNVMNYLDINCKRCIVLYETTAHI